MIESNNYNQLQRQNNNSHKQSPTQLWNMLMSRASLLWINTIFIAGSFLAVLGRRHDRSIHILSSLGKLPSMSSIHNHERKMLDFSNTTQLVVANAIEGYYSTRIYDDENCNEVNSIWARALNRCISLSGTSWMYTANSTTFSRTLYDDEKCSTIESSFMSPLIKHCRSSKVESTATPTLNFPPTSTGITSR